MKKNTPLKKRVLRASSTIVDNFDDADLVEESGTSLLNNQSWGDLLIDPQDMPENLHASVKKPKAKKMMKAADLEEDDLLEDLPADGLDAPLESDFDDLLEDDDSAPASLALIGADDAEDSAEEETPAAEEEEKDAGACRARASKMVKSLRARLAKKRAMRAAAKKKRQSAAVTVLSESEETDVLPADIPEQKKIETEDAYDKTEVEENNETDRQRDGKPMAAAKKKSVKADEVEIENHQKNGQLEIDSSAEFNLVDVDGVDDAAEDVLFASIDTTKVAIHANRIIAVLCADDAQVNDVADVYLDDEFDEAVAAEIQQKGLRAGLRSMGFKLATVKVKADAQVKASVVAQTAAFKRELTAKQKAKEDVRAQAMAIASIGLNRNMFKNYANTLREDLVSRFENLGVRNANKVVRAAFEKCGVEYAQNLIKAADAISELPDESRDAMAEQLDMTQEPEDNQEVMADPNLYGDPVSADGAEEDAQPCEADEDLGDAPVEAALRTPIKAAHIVQKIKSSGLSFARYY